MAFKKTAETFKEGAKTLPAHYYTKDDIFKKEMSRIFRNYPVCIGHVSKIPNPGNYFLFDELGDNLIVVRDKEGVIHAFQNTCRHRGTRICKDPTGKFGATIQCGYHGWTYNLRGNLIGAPDAKGTPGFKMEEYSLGEVTITIWHGFIFLGHVEDYGSLTELGNKLSGWNMGGLKIGQTISYDLKANWKYVVQNFSECLHCPTLHPQLHKLTNYKSGENDFTEGPILGGSLEITGGESMTTSGRLCGLPIRTDGERGKLAYYYSILPNLLLNIHPDYVMYHLLYPESFGRTKVVSEWLFHPDAPMRSDFNPSEAIDFWHLTNKQDWEICELGQLGVASSGYKEGPYTDRESLLVAFDEHYLRLVG